MRGERLGPWVVERVISVGGAATIAQARHEQTNVLATLTVFQKANLAFRHARQGLPASPHLVSVIDVGGLPDERGYVVAEWLDGEDLDTRLGRVGQMELGEVFRVCDHAAKGLSSAHDAGIVHRDLKPANLFIATTPGGEVVKVLDFGMSKMLDGGSGAVMGTPLYMSPEQVHAVANIDARSDIYSLGAILYNAIAGRPPYDAPTFMGILAMIAGPTLPAPLADSRPGLPPGVDPVIRRAMAKRPEDRYQSVLHLRDELGVALGISGAARA